MSERYLVLTSFHLLILSVDHTKKAFVYEVKHKNPSAPCIHAHFHNGPNVSLLAALAYALLKESLLLGAMPRARLRMELTCSGPTSQGRHFTDFSGALAHFLRQ